MSDTPELWRGAWRLASLCSRYARVLGAAEYLHADTYTYTQRARQPPTHSRSLAVQARRRRHRVLGAAECLHTDKHTTGTPAAHTQPLTRRAGAPPPPQFALAALPA